ncbi:preprotein translocase subunit SecA [Bacillus toyonensis]|uniref:preprotein translocase subunit SecA n=1 Tax=Bacillus toyonensis TaxID=155322 RepID=UPI002E1EF65B|nr:preprotein translocase subunit SecA [Bacillus toyonensis]MED2737266.1 preprotein translocase subunit SecA [Bacillus toyonensis]
MGLQQLLDNRRIKKYMKIANKVIEKQVNYAKLEDADFKKQTNQWRDNFKGKEISENDQTEIFALAREAAKRVLGLEAFPVQLIGGIVLSDGNVAEMKTGEGKTLVSLFAIFYEVIKGSKVHLITANDYLAERDKSIIGKALEFLGITVGLNSAGLSLSEKREIYKNDVIYGTASEFGFDYLRDNMTSSVDDWVQSGLDFVLIDEADSILIDEARTPLIISGKKQEDLGMYKRANLLLKKFTEEDYEYNVENNSVWLADSGIDKAQKFWGVDDLYSLDNQGLLRATNLMLKAYFTMKKDKDYVVQDGEILIVDQNTGRIMDGRRFSEGLHQAIEAKESVEVKDETVTLATVTIQNYFRMYQKIGGMTGTAKTEEEELQKIYGLDVIVIPTHREIARIDEADEIYLSKEEKGLAIVQEVLERHTAGQPVLVGTASIEDNEWLSDLFNKNNIPHQVLNAKNHGREADIISNAGEKGAVTIATNMAGRGTDIKLADGVKELGGLAVIGTEKHESRRIDNQLKGRSGRQGDPGYSKFILSLEDELIERFNGKKIKELAEKLGFPKNEPISHRMVVKAITGAQKRMEGSNFDIRKNLLEYDEVMDIQRKFIYNERKEIMDIKDTKAFSQAILKEFVKAQIQQRYDEAEPEKTMEWLVNELTGAIQPGEFNIDYIDDVIEGVQKKVLENYELKRKNVGDEILNEVEKTVFLELIDQFWVKHIDHLVNLKEGIHLRAYAQSNPLVEYQKEAAGMFQGMLDELQYYYSMNVIHFQISVVPE